MIGPLVALVGLLPLVVLAPLALFVLVGGLMMLFDEPALGASFVAWATAGLLGTRALVRAANGTWTDNTVPGLLAGIGAAAPLVWGVVQELEWDSSVVMLYVTAGPIVIALGYLYVILVKESTDIAWIVEIDGNAVSSLPWKACDSKP